MPLPFIPIAIGLGALATAAFGAKQGYDAKQNFDKAESITKRARRIYDSARSALEQTRIETQKKLEELGGLKVDIYKNGLLPFVETFERIKNIDFSDPDLNIDRDLIMKKHELADIREVALKMSDYLGGAAASATGGILAGFGALGGVTLLGTASTGTAISALTGVAATNATLAWFGGGALAAGGLGITGGMAVLGGVFAAPVLAVGGWLLNSKAEEAVSDAYSNLDKAKGAAESMKTANSGAQAILRRTDEIKIVLEELNTPLKDKVYHFTRLVDYNDNFKTYTDHEKNFVGSVCSVVKTSKNIMEVPIFDEQGSVTQKSEEMLSTARNFLNSLSKM